MRRLLAVGGLVLVVWLVAGCVPENVVGTVNLPLCPISPEAWDAADYAPLGCVKP